MRTRAAFGRRLKRRVAWDAFGTWTSWAFRARTLRVAAARSVARMQHSTRAKAFARWAEFAETRRRLQAVGAKLENLNLSRSFSVWLDMTNIWRDERLRSEQQRQYELLCEERDAHVQRGRTMALGSIVRRWQQRNLSRCFAAFEVYTASRLRGKHLLSRACLLYTSPSPRDATLSRMPSSA